VTRAQAWIDILLVPLLFGVGGTVVAVLGGALLLPVPVLLLVHGVLLLAALTWLLARREQRWRDVGLLPFAARDTLRALLVFATCLVANVVLTFLISLLAPQLETAHLERLRGTADLVVGDMPLPLVAFTMLAVGVYEELAARGFLLARFRCAMRGRLAPVVLSSMVFGVGHLYQGALGVLQTTLIGVILAVYTVRWGTLWPAVIAHALLNTASIAALQRFSAV
jgi:membrane protease YdiL (CAAX protease family)